MLPSAPVTPPVDAAASAATHITCPRKLPAWLAEQRVSLAFSTYQAGRLYLVGQDDAGELAASEWALPSCMGLWTDGQTLCVGSQVQLFRLENALATGATREGRDRVFVPRTAWVTGDLDTHDVAMGEDGRPVFVSTTWNCLATVDAERGARAIWRPPFISKLVPEDRCHLNGLAMQDGRPAWVTVVSRSDVVDGWRERRAGGGCVIDVRTGETVVEGLSMPHSPRWYRRSLWLHDSGTGHFGRVDLARGVFEPVAFCPGYLRGLAFAGDYAIAGLSRPRHDKTFGGLPLEQNLAARGVDARCGLHVIDLRTGDVAQWLRIEGAVRELYDVVVLPGVRRPEVIPLDSDEIARTVTVDAAEAARVFA